MIAELQKDAASVGSEILLFNIGDDMARFLEDSLMATASRTPCSTKAGAPRPREPKDHVIIPVAWRSGFEYWGETEAGRMTSVRAYMGGDIHPLLDLILDGPHAEVVDVEVALTKSPVAKGEIRLAYYCKLLPKYLRYWKRPLERTVAKESIFKGSSNSKQVLFNQAHLQLVAPFLGSAFSRITRDNWFGTRPICYPNVKVLHLPGRPEGRQYYCVEEYIEGEYQKFNSNNGYVNRDLEAALPGFFEGRLFEGNPAPPHPADVLPLLLPPHTRYPPARRPARRRAGWLLHADGSGDPHGRPEGPP